jgi:hypothetical protein
LAASPVSAQDAWEYTVAPYIWGAGLSGEVGTLPPLPPGTVDLSFGDIWENLEFAGMIAGSARNGRWAISGDFQYIQLGARFDTPGPLFDGGQLRASTTIFTLLGEYELTGRDDAALWIGGGARYWNVNTELQLRSGLLASRTLDHDDSWLDPILGLRGNAALTDRVFVTGWAYAGGFGAGSESMSDLFGGVGWKFTETTSGILGYRYLAVDRNDDGFVFDVEQRGPMAGVAFRF